MYCLKCRKHTATKNASIQTTKNGRRRAVGNCSVCNTKKGQFVPKEITGEGLTDWLNKFSRETKRRVKGITTALTGVRTNLPPTVRTLLAKIGHRVPTNLQVCRAPINANVEFAVRLINKIPYDKLFHLSLRFDIDGTRYLMDKTEVLRLRRVLPSDIKPQLECIPVSGSPPTLREMFDNTKRRMGASFAIYSAHQYNCQDFINNVLTANKLDADRKFIMQDIQGVLGKVPKFIAQKATDLASKLNLITQGYGLKQPKVSEVKQPNQKLLTSFKNVKPHKKSNHNPPNY